MNFKIFGKQVKVGETFSRYVETSLKQTIHKYFENPISSIVSVSKKNKLFYIIVIVHINKKMEFTAQSNGQTAKLAFNETIEKLSKQLDPAVNELIRLLASDDEKIKQRAVDQIMKYNGEDEIKVAISGEMDIKLNWGDDAGILSEWFLR